MFWFCNVCLVLDSLDCWCEDSKFLSCLSILCWLLVLVRFLIILVVVDWSGWGWFVDVLVCCWNNCLILFWFFICFFNKVICNNWIKLFSMFCFGWEDVNIEGDCNYVGEVNKCLSICGEIVFCWSVLICVGCILFFILFMDIFVFVVLDIGLVGSNFWMMFVSICLFFVLFWLVIFCSDCVKLLMLIDEGFIFIVLKWSNVWMSCCILFLMFGVCICRRFVSGLLLFNVVVWICLFVCLDIMLVVCLGLVEILFVLIEIDGFWIGSFFEMLVFFVSWIGVWGIFNSWVVESCNVWIVCRFVLGKVVINVLLGDVLSNCGCVFKKWVVSCFFVICRVIGMVLLFVFSVCWNWLVSWLMIFLGNWLMCLIFIFCWWSWVWNNMFNIVFLLFIFRVFIVVFVFSCVCLVVLDSLFCFIELLLNCKWMFYLLFIGLVLIVINLLIIRLLVVGLLGNCFKVVLGSDSILVLFVDIFSCSVFWLILVIVVLICRGWVVLEVSCFDNCCNKVLLIGCEMCCWFSLVSSVILVGSVRVGVSCVRDCGSFCVFIIGKVVGKCKSNNWLCGFIVNCFVIFINNVLLIFCSVVEKVWRLFDCVGWVICINCVNCVIVLGFMLVLLRLDNSVCLDLGDKFCVEGVSCINCYWCFL